MTFDEFKADTLAFVESSRVNLGRKATKTRVTFIEALAKKFDDFWQSSLEVEAEICEKPEKSTINPMGDSVLCIKPGDPRKGLDVGKGVHAMTPGESQRADEQLHRSPFVGKDKKNE